MKELNQRMNTFIIDEHDPMDCTRRTRVEGENIYQAIITYLENQGLEREKALELLEDAEETGDHLHVSMGDITLVVEKA